MLKKNHCICKYSFSKISKVIYSFLIAGNECVIHDLAEVHCSLNLVEIGTNVAIFDTASLCVCCFSHVLQIVSTLCPSVQIHW